MLLEAPRQDRIKTLFSFLLTLAGLPIFSLCFFSYVQYKFDRDALVVIKESIDQDPNLSTRERRDLKRLFDSNPLSKILSSNAPEFAEIVRSVDPDTKRDYAIFRWMIRFSAANIVSGIAFFGFVWLGSLFAARSQPFHYWTLRFGWHALVIFSFVHLIAQASLLVALSYWVPGVLFNVYFPMLMFFTAAISVASLGKLLLAVARVKLAPLQLEGRVVTQQDAPLLWNEADKLSLALQTAKPDQIIIGIDYNFLVTESPLLVNQETYKGRSLVISLSLLKWMQGIEARSILAHELAHFAGQDTMFSEKIAPLMARIERYLTKMREGVLTQPLFHCAWVFQWIQAKSFAKLSQEREFRADRIAAEQTNAQNFASALLRCSAYADYRIQIESELFDLEALQANLKISKRIEEGFRHYVVDFANHHELCRSAIAHPFDSHPTLNERLNALGVAPKDDWVAQTLAKPGDGSWYQEIPNSERIENELWESYESKFLEWHEQALAFRYLPLTDEELELVSNYFPTIEVPGYQNQTISISCERILFPAWDQPLYFSELNNISIHQHDGIPTVLLLVAREDKEDEFELFLDKSSHHQQRVIETLKQYWHRYQLAAEYQDRKNEFENAQE